MWYFDSEIFSRCDSFFPADKIIVTFGFLDLKQTNKNFTIVSVRSLASHPKASLLPSPPDTSLPQTWRRDSTQPTLEEAMVKVIALHPPGSPVLKKTCALCLGTFMQGWPWAETPLREVGRGEGCSGGQRGRRLEHPFLRQVQGLSSPPFWSFSSPFFHPLIRAPGLDVEVL